MKSKLMDNTLKASSTKKAPKAKKNEVKEMKPNLLDPKAFNAYCDEHKDPKSLLIKETTKEDIWTSQLLPEASEKDPVPFQIRKKLKQVACTMYEKQLVMYESLQRHQPQSAKDRAMQTGATSNILIGLMNKCFKYPVYTLESFQKLIGYITPKKKHDVRKAFEYVQALLRVVYLPKGYVAREFECHSFTALLPYLSSSKQLVDQQLVLWYFEDRFTHTYKELINNLSQLMQESLYKVKFSAIQQMTKLLIAHPSQEPELILSKLINKLGDPLQTVAGSSIHLIRSLTFECSQLNNLLVSIIDEFLHRSNLNDKAKYYGLCLLKDIKFKKEDGDLAMKMIKIYTQFFTTCMKQGDVDNRFMSCLLTGMNRAYPYIEEYKTPQFEQEMTTLYKLTHLVNHKIAFKAMSLIYSVISRSSSVSDRFYQLLYSKVLEATESKYPLKNNAFRLIYQAMCSDPSLPRLKAFIKRLLQTGLHLSSEHACAVIIIISNVVQNHEGLENSKEFLWEIVSHHEAYKLSNQESDDEKPKICKAESYDCAHRNPLFAGANLTHIWELSLLEKHFHPSVRNFSSLVSSDQLVECEGDPLVSFSLSNFLDRMINKKPKPMKKNLNVFAPKAKKSNLPKLPFGSERFKSLDESKIAPEDIFIHRYFSKYHKNRDNTRDEIEVNEDDDLFESILKKKNFGHYLPDPDKDLNFAASAKRPDGSQEDADSGSEPDPDDFDDAEIEDIDDMDDDNMEELGSDDDEIIEFDDDDDEEENYTEELDKLEFDQGGSDIEDSDDGGSDFENDFEEEDWPELDEEELEVEPHTAKKSGKRRSKTKRELDEDSDEDYGIFGDGFTHMLEEEPVDETRGTSEAILNRDKSNKEQLRWESKKSGNKRTGSFPKKRHGGSFKKTGNKKRRHR